MTRAHGLATYVVHPLHASIHRRLDRRGRIGRGFHLPEKVAASIIFRRLDKTACRGRKLFVGFGEDRLHDGTWCAYTQNIEPPADHVFVVLFGCLVRRNGKQNERVVDDVWSHVTNAIVNTT